MYSTVYRSVNMFEAVAPPPGNKFLIYTVRSYCGVLLATASWLGLIEDGECDDAVGAGGRSVLIRRAEPEVGRLECIWRYYKPLKEGALSRRCQALKWDGRSAL